MNPIRPMRQADAAAPGLIGPNAVLQLVAALENARPGSDAMQLLTASGLSEWLDRPPAAMVDERRVARLHQTLRKSTEDVDSVRLLEDAGRRTADYLLAFRIPRPVQFLLTRLPARLAARVLIAAIRRNAWTFVGSGRFTARLDRTVRIRIEDNPLCAGEHAELPVCHWHRAVFQRLFEVLVSPTARVLETECEASGDAACCFEIYWHS